VRASQQSPPVRQPSAPTVTPALSTRHTQPHQLLSAQYARGQVTSQSMPTQVTSTPAPATAPVPASENDLFSLDFHAPPANATPTTTAPAHTKQDILSLFGAQAAPSPWSQAQAQATQLQSQPLPPFSNATSASSSTTNWNVGHSWTNPVPPAQLNVWGATTPVQQPSLLDSGSDIWGGSTGANAGPFGSSTPARNTQTNKEDVFGDIWGGFK
jgi:stromal membrane-associated protein